MSFGTTLKKNKTKNIKNSFKRIFAKKNNLHFTFIDKVEKVLHLFQITLLKESLKYTLMKKKL